MRIYPGPFFFRTDISGDGVSLTAYAVVRDCEIEGGKVILRVDGNRRRWLSDSVMIEAEIPETIIWKNLSPDEPPPDVLLRTADGDLYATLQWGQPWDRMGGTEFCLVASRDTSRDALGIVRP